MRGLGRLAMALSLGAGGAPAAAAAQDSAPALPFKISGYVTSAYTYSSANVESGIVGHFYDRFHDQFVLNAAAVTIERPVATDKVDAGFKAQVIFGQNAAVLHSSGLSLGDQGDLPQAFVTLNLPTGEGTYVQFKMGKMWTLMGVEVLDDVGNPNLSVANQFVFVENFTNLGAGVDVKFSGKVDAQFRIMNGWDLVEDNNTRKSFMARVGITPSEKVGLGFLGFYGPEQADNTDDNRHGGEFVGTFKAGAKSTVFAQFDYGAEEFGTDKAKWWGAGLWLAQELSPTAILALRGDYVDDKNGARSSGVTGYAPAGRRKFGSGTATLNIKYWPNVLVRPEVRVDFSDLEDFGETDDPKKSQFTLALGASYVF